MPNPPFIVEDERIYYVGGTQPAVSPTPVPFRRFYTWASNRVMMVGDDESAGPTGFINYGFYERNSPYPPYVNGFQQGAVDTKAKLFRGVPYGIAIAFKFDPQPTDPPTNDVYAFWGGFYEFPPDSGQILQAIGAAIDWNEYGLILNGAVVVCENVSFTTAPSSYDASGMGQLLGNYPADWLPGQVVSITSP